MGGPAAGRRLLTGRARVPQHLAPACRAAVERGGLRALHLDLEVVDAKRGHRRQQVLDGADDRDAAREHRLPLHARDVVHYAGDLRPVVEIDAAEQEARVRIRGPQGRPHGLAGVQTIPVQ